MKGLEQRTKRLTDEAFENLLDSIEDIKLDDEILDTQLEQFKDELINLKQLSGRKDAELLDTQNWLRYSLEQIRHDIPPYVVHRFYTLFALLRTQA